MPDQHLNQFRVRCFLFTILLMGFFSSWLRASNYRDEPSGTLFLDAIGSLERGKEQHYEAEPGQGGVAVPYHGKNAEVTVYVRRVPPEAAQTAEEALEDALAGIKQLETLGKYSDVKVYRLDPHKVRAGWKGAVFTSKSESRFIVSFIYCRAAPGHLFKVRATTGDPKNEQLTTDLDLLLTAIDANGTKP